MAQPLEVFIQCYITHQARDFITLGILLGLKSRLKKLSEGLKNNLMMVY